MDLTYDLREIICSEYTKFREKIGPDDMESYDLWIQKIEGLGISWEVLWLERGLIAADDFARFANKNPNCVYSIGHNEDELFQESHKDENLVEDTLIYAVPKDLAEKIVIFKGLP